MKDRRLRFMSTLLVTLMVALAGTLAYGQGTVTTSLSGTVKDASGAVIPGADVTIKNNATAAVSNTVTGADGTFTVPALQPGTYTVTVALMGFKTWSAPDIALNASVPAFVNVKLEIGKLEETVVVEGAAQLVQTQTSAVATTISAKAISNLPISRAAFDVVLFTPGVNTSDGSLRDSTVNGLPQSVTNITLDGMNIQDNYAKTWDGMFTRVSPRLDAVEEVTVGTAAQGADMAGQGAVQIKFVTRSGTNNYQGSLYYYFRREWMNTNTWFNLHRNVDKVTGKPQPLQTTATYQPGGRFGGPIVIPGLFDGHDKAFFFVNYEWVKTPGTRTDTRTIMTPLSEQGVFKYAKGQVNLWDLAKKTGQTATPDPLVAKLLADIRASTAVTGVVNDNSDGLTQSFAWQQPTKGNTKYPTIRLDYNITSKHRLTASLTQNHLISDPDTTNSQQTVFPGFPVHGLQDSYRWTSQLSLRSTLTPNMVNELRVGGTGGATLFSPDLDPAMYSASVGNMNGYSIALNTFKGINNPSPSRTNSAREGSTRLVEDILSWIKGAHSISSGFSFTQANVWLRNSTLAPGITLGIANGDPADSAMFTAANFPGATSTELGYAKNLYAVLTGRVTEIGYTARIGEDGTNYVVNGTSMARGRLPDMGFFVQDSWRWKPYLTINAGLRYALQMPFYALNNSYSMATVADMFGLSGVGSNFVPGSTVTDLGNLFQLGVKGTATTYQLLSKNTPAYNTDKNNLAPSIGVALKVGGPSGLRHLIFGDDAVIRGGFNIAYQRGGMSDFTEVFGANPGLSVDSPTRNQTNGNLGTVPVLLSSANLGPGAFQATRTYPMAVPSASSNVYVFDPNIKVPYATSFTIGVQRAINKSTSGEVRFIHTGSHGTWTLQNVAGAYNYNEANIVENGFLNEFKLAQQNLVANQGTSFAYMGPGTGTNPLPILLAWLSGSTDVNNKTAYSGKGWTNSGYITNLVTLNPNPNSMASSIRQNADYKANAAKVAVPANFFVANPDVTNARMATNGTDTRFNSIQLILNRRFAQGLYVQANYSYGKGYQYAFYGFHKPFVETLQNYSNMPAGGGSTVHSFAANWVYDLPIGQGRRFGSGVGRGFNYLIGNWSWMGTARLTSGRLLDFGNVRMVGFTIDDLRNMYQLRFTGDPNNPYRTRVFMLPQDVIDNTVKAFSYDWKGYTSGAPTGRYFAPANGPDCIESTPGYGDCGARSLIVTGPKIVRFDMSLSKDIRVTSRVALQFQVQIYNIFNRVNFNPVTWDSSLVGSSSRVASNPDAWEVGSAQDQARTGQLAFRILF